MPRGMPKKINKNMVVNSANKFAKFLVPHIEELETLLVREAGNLASSSATVEGKNLRLQEIIDSATEVILPATACKSGCSHCCRMAVGILSSEAITIGNYVGILPAEMTEDRDSEQLIKKFLGVPCPFLTNGRCSIYPVRPVACRTYFNVSCYSEICNVIDYPGMKVPNLNWTSVLFAMAQINMETSVFADIREFFPHVVPQGYSSDAINCKTTI